MAQSRHLRIASVDDATGEVEELEKCPDCSELERELQRQRTIIANLRRDKLAEAKADPLYGYGSALFFEWQFATGHDRSRWPGKDGQRFWECEPYLRVDGFVICRWAVWGVALWPNGKTLPDGSEEVYDDWELAFRTRGHFERYARRGYRNPEARRLYSLREQGLGEDDETIDPNKYFDAIKRGVRPRRQAIK